MVVVLCFVFALAAGIVVAGYGPGGGGGPNGGPGQGKGPGNCPYNGTRITGEITQIEANNTSFTLDIGKSVINVLVTEKTVIKSGPDKVNFDDLKVGQKVCACGELKDQTMTAIMVNIQRCSR